MNQGPMLDSYLFSLIMDNLMAGNPDNVMRSFFFSDAVIDAH